MAAHVGEAGQSLTAYDLGFPSVCGAVEVVGQWLVYSETTFKSNLLHAINLTALPDRTADCCVAHPIEHSRSIFCHIVRRRENSFLTVDREADQIYQWRIESGVLVEESEKRLPLDGKPEKFSCTEKTLFCISKDLCRVETLRLDAEASQWQQIFNEKDPRGYRVNDIATHNDYCAIAHATQCYLYKINEAGEGELIYQHCFADVSACSEVSLLAFVNDNRFVGVLHNGSGFSVSYGPNHFTCTHFPRPEKTPKPQPRALAIFDRFIAVGARGGIFLLCSATGELFNKITSMTTIANEETTSCERKIEHIRNMKAAGNTLVLRLGNCHIYVVNLPSSE